MNNFNNLIKVESLNRDTGVNVSEKYQVIKSGELVKEFERQGYVITSLKQARHRKIEYSGSGLHEIRLTHPSFAALGMPEGLRPEIVMLNSYNGTCAYRLFLGIFRLVCSNGLVAGEAYEALHVRHIGHDVLPKVLAAVERIGTKTAQLIESVKTMQATQLTLDQQIDFANRVGRLLMPKSAIEGLTDFSQLLDVKRDADMGSDLFTVLNRIQENSMRGGLRYIASNEVTGRTRFQRLRAVRAIDRANSLNQSLWDIAESYITSNQKAA